jgi:hypothetical protein
VLLPLTGDLVKRCHEIQRSGHPSPECRTRWGSPTGGASRPHPRLAAGQLQCCSATRICERSESGPLSRRRVARGTTSLTQKARVATNDERRESVAGSEPHRPRSFPSSPRGRLGEGGRDGTLLPSSAHLGGVRGRIREIPEAQSDCRNSSVRGFTPSRRREDRSETGRGGSSRVARRRQGER